MTIYTRTCVAVVADFRYNHMASPDMAFSAIRTILAQFRTIRIARDLPRAVVSAQVVSRAQQTLAFDAVAIRLAAGLRSSSEIRGTARCQLYQWFRAVQALATGLTCLAGWCSIYLGDDR